MALVPSEGCQKCLTLNNSTTAGADCLKFGCVCLDTSYLLLFHRSEVGCICTCARVLPFSTSRERLGGLRWNLVCGYWLDQRVVLHMSQKKGASTHAHMHMHITSFSYLGNGNAFAPARSSSIKTSYQLVKKWLRRLILRIQNNDKIKFNKTNVFLVQLCFKIAVIILHLYDVIRKCE